MSESGEEKEDTLNDQNNADDNDEFSFYLQFTKPLVLELAEPEDRALAAAWVRKLEGGSNDPGEKQLRINYLKLLLFVLQRGRLGGIFRKQPPSGPLQSFPPGFNVFDMGNLILDQDDFQSLGAGDGHAVNYNTEVSNDLREFVASQEIPNFGVQMYYAWSADEPINKWDMFDEDKFPQYILDKIKLLKKTHSDEKSGSSTKNCGLTKKKVFDLSVLEKLSKKKVKTPQEIEKSQGRSFHTYLGLVGRMGNFEKCDPHMERLPRAQQPQSRGTCSRRIAENQNQNQCSGQGQRRFINLECEDDQGEDNFQNFAPGLSNLVNAQSRPCLCPYPYHAQCPEHRGSRGESHHESIARASMTNNSSRQICPVSDAGSRTVTKAPLRFNNVDPANVRVPSMGAPEGYQGAQCPQRRTASSPTTRSNLVGGTNVEPPAQDFYSRPGISNFCTCPCPRLPPQMLGHSASATGVMGGMGYMGGMGFMGGMPIIGGMGGMPAIGGMGGMPVIGGMGGMPGMPGMPGMGGMGCMANTGGMGGMQNMGAMGGMQNMGGGRTCPSGKQTAQEKPRPNIRWQCSDSGQLASSFRTPPSASCSRAEATPSQTAAPSGSRPGVSNARSRQQIMHCYDNQQTDASFTHTIQRNANTMEGSATYTRNLPAGVEENPQACLEDGTPDDLTRRNERLSIVAAARENRACLAAKKSLFDPEPPKTPSAQFVNLNTTTVTKRQQSPATEGRMLAFTSSSSERMIPSDRSSPMEPLSRSQSPSHSPRPQAPCPAPQQAHYCTPKASKAPNYSFQNENNYGQDRPACPAAATKTLSPARPINAKTVNLSKKSQNPKKGGIFAVNNESARLSNMPGLLQDMRQMVENYRSGAEENISSRQEACPIGQRESNLDLGSDFATYTEPPIPKPGIYYSPQPRRRNIVTSPYQERDIASFPDRMSGMGIFNPQKMPTQAQPLPDTPPDCTYIDYTRLEGDEESFLYTMEDSSYEPPRCPPGPSAEQPPIYINSGRLPGHSSPATAERSRDYRRRDHSADFHLSAEESKTQYLNLPSTIYRKHNARNIICSTPTRSAATLPSEFSTIHQYSSLAADSNLRPPIGNTTEYNEPPPQDFVQIFGSNLQDENFRGPSQQRDSVYFETMECATHQDN